MRSQAIVLVASLLEAAACGQTVAVTASEQPVLSKEFTIAEGQAVTITNTNTALRITFRRADDSRCPSNVHCVWAGEAAVELGLSGIGPAVIDTVGTRATFGDATYGGYAVHYVDLVPYPVANGPAKPRSVKLTVTPVK